METGILAAARRIAEAGPTRISVLLDIPMRDALNTVMDAHRIIALHGEGA